jgi:hypothetical protein
MIAIFTILDAEMLNPIGKTLPKWLPLFFAAALMVPMAVRAESQPAKALLSYEQTIQSYHQALEADRASMSPQRYREISQMFHALFDAPAVKITVRGVSEEGAQRATIPSKTIYFSKGDIFIIPDPIDSTSTRPPEKEEFFATLNGKVYTWREGSKGGQILSRLPNDTIAFLLYSIDPGMMMGSLYRDYYQQKPQDFIKTKQGENQRLMFKQPKSGFAGVVVRENPFWLTGILFETQDSKQPKVLWGLEVDPPVPLQVLPETIKQLPKGVNFTPSGATLKNWAVYL